jgi:plastocyanin
MAQNQILLVTSLALLFACAAADSAPSSAQSFATGELRTEVTARLVPAQVSGATKPVQHRPAVIWLNPVALHSLPTVVPGKFTLMQKNKMFSPHLLVVPVGSIVAFPNADPFFHNVFSLFDGRRFDLGLYEAGSSRTVTFSREGVSYIFCNIHAEMSAVVISLATPLYGTVDARDVFHIRDVPEGDYDLHVWIEGQKQDALDHLTRRVHIASDARYLGEIRSDHPEAPQHLDKFGRPYEPDAHPIY